MSQPKTFKAILLKKQDGAFSCDLKNLTMNDLPDNDVTIAVRYSSLNYKGGLALTNRSPVARQWPMVPGNDFAGDVPTAGEQILAGKIRGRVAVRISELIDMNACSSS